MGTAFQPSEAARRWPNISLVSGVSKKRLVGLVLFAVILGLFLAFNRFPKLEIVSGDLDAVSGPVVECFQGFCIESDPNSSFVSRWLGFSVDYLRFVTIGMTFAFLVAGLSEAFLFPRGSGLLSSRSILGGTFKGLAIGPVMNLCSACIVPLSASFRRRGGPIEGAIAMVQGSSTLNLPALIMAAMIFAPMLGGSRIVLSIVGGLAIGPLVAWVARERRNGGTEHSHEETRTPEPPGSWGDALSEGFREWGKSSLGYLVRLGPIMVLAGFASGLAIQWINPEHVSEYLGNNASGIAIAATLGILLNVPLMFEIPLVALLLLMGMGVAPAATLLFAAAAGGPVTFWGLARTMSRKATVSFAGATWAVALLGGLAMWGLVTLAPGNDVGFRPNSDAATGGGVVVGADVVAEGPRITGED